MLNKTASIDYDNLHRGLPSLPNRKSKDEINDIVHTKKLYWYWEYEDELRRMISSKNFFSNTSSPN